MNLIHEADTMLIDDLLIDSGIVRYLLYWK